MPLNGGLAEGQLFAGYTIVRRLGAGGMGQVYLAQHPRLPRRDAVKVLPGDLTADLEFRQRFNREADLAASLYHEHIVGIHDRGEYDEQLWISMDYVEGTDAAELLRKEYPAGMPESAVVEIITAVADALDYAHSRGLLHRDVKPANILLGGAEARRRILLADFGIARELGEISGLTGTNMLVGTAAYCSPEQLKGAELDARADQYALACTAFNLLTGAAPFEHSNPAVVISRHLSEPPPLVSARRPELAAVDSALTRALAKTPEERYASCADFAAALAGTASGVAAAAARPTAAIEAPTEVLAVRAATAPTTEPGGRRAKVVLVAALVAAAVVAVAAVVGFQMLRGRSVQHSGSKPTTAAAAQTPSFAALQLTNPITDVPGVLTPVEHGMIDRALTKLYNEHSIRLWVVYVNDFGGMKPFRWAEATLRANGFDGTDAILAIATAEPAYSFRVPDAVINGKAIDVEAIRRERIQPAVFRLEWTRAAIAAANGLDVAPG